MSQATRLYRGLDLSSERDQYIHIYFLGTGSPALTVDRHGIATLIKAGPHWLLFDTGRATLQQMYECGVPIPDVTNVFYTHLHSDHICGFGDFWVSGWFVQGRTTPISVWGPPGTQQFIDGMQGAHHFDLTVRPKYEGNGVTGLQIEVTEFEEGVVFDRDGVVVTAFLVDHGPVVKPAFGFRLDWGGRSVVLSGDTTYCDTLVKYATGADVLINEIAGASFKRSDESPHIRKIVKSHTSPEELAEMCRQARPRFTMLHHISLWGVTEFDVIDRIRAAGYDGVVEIGEDRMEMLVGPEIRIVPPGVPSAAVR
jgi:ribonuclease Z